MCPVYRLCVHELHLQMITVKAGCTAVSYIWCGMSQLPLKDTAASVVIMTLGTTVEMYAISFMQRILIMFQNVTSQQGKMITIFHLGINYDSTVAAPAS